MNPEITIANETTQDFAGIRQIIEIAFKQAEHSSGTEAEIVEELRNAEALAVSLVAKSGQEIVGHAAFSPVMIDGKDAEWYGLGPVAVRPDWQRKGIGSKLIRKGLGHLSDLGGKGCVVLGDPSYYHRFGFETDAGLKLEGVPPEFFMRLVLLGPEPKGLVTYHKAFEAE
ncbi:N-acetyltransferase [uncultured Sneathiella sp.]|uniref:GNAT family N-acetyltransferase n=1 Tax=uncultured Sneathiella sp. TaxID=879315 RepID=UPI0025916E93|nr:N-acetyltransferase [uncultured Sneathiella sp.]